MLRRYDARLRAIYLPLALMISRPRHAMLFMPKMMRCRFFLILYDFDALIIIFSFRLFSAMPPISFRFHAMLMRHDIYCLFYMLLMRKEREEDMPEATGRDAT